MTHNFVSSVFSCISKSVFDKEHELRVMAEANARSLANQLAQAEERISQLVEMIERESKARAAEMKDLLDRFIPKAQSQRSAPDTPARPYTAEVARQLRAIGKSDMRFRASEVRRLEEEELTAEQRADRRRRHDSLTEEERKGLSQAEGDLLDNILEKAARQEEGK